MNMSRKMPVLVSPGTDAVTIPNLAKRKIQTPRSAKNSAVRTKDFLAITILRRPTLKVKHVTWAAAGQMFCPIAVAKKKRQSTTEEPIVAIKLLTGISTPKSAVLTNSHANVMRNAKIISFLYYISSLGANELFRLLISRERFETIPLPALSKQPALIA